MGDDTGDDNTYDCRRALTIAGRQVAVAADVDVGAQTFLQKIGIAHLQARIKKMRE